LPDVRPEATEWLRRARKAEAEHNLPAAFDAYQHALSLAPDSAEIIHHLADLAFRLTQWDVAEKLYAHLCARDAADVAGMTGYAATLREQGRYDDAIELLKTALGHAPQVAALWESLGSVMLSQCNRDMALVFLDEALRLDPGNLPALFNRGCVRMEKGDLTGGLADVSDCARRFKDTGNQRSAELTCAHAALALGDLKAGWQWYEARHMRGTSREIDYRLKPPRWKPGQTIAGKRLFVSAEQGLGDEILFASLLPDLVEALGDGRLGIGVEPRLVPLFQRSFPEATVVAHHTEMRDGCIRRDFPDLDAKAFDLWALMGDFLTGLRGAVRDFPRNPAFLTADPERVVYWRGYLAGLNAKPKVGVIWKSLKSSALRDRAFSPFEEWQGILSTPGIQCINLQYGDAEAELAATRAAGLDIHTPVGIDLKQDLDDLAALCVALDLVVGPPTATTNLAAACGTPIWLITPPQPWLALGESYYPWYPRSQLFIAPGVDEWAPVMASIAESLQAMAG
jgi:tetratricopeptide (TPR) repeat protein